MTNPVGYEGEALQLIDGRTVHVRYSMKALLRLEETFGSIAAVQSSISQDGTGAIFTPGLKLVACGLLHETDRNGAPLDDPSRLADLLEPARFQEAVSAAGRALAAAFPQAAQDAAAASASTGSSGTTSPASPSASPSGSSGA